MRIELSIFGKKHIIVVISVVLLVLSCIPQNEAYAMLTPMIRSFRYLALIWSVLLFFTSKMYYIRTNWILYAFMIWILLTSLFNGTSLDEVIKLIYPIFSSVVLTQYIIEKDKKKGLVALAIFFAIFMLIEAISALTHCFGDVYVGAWQGNYFFGIRVNVCFLLPYAIGLNLLYSKIDKKKGNFFWGLTLICSIYFVIYESVSTSIVTIAVILVGLLILHLYRFRKELLKPTIAVLIFLCAGFALIGSRAEIFRWLLVDILQEDITLSGRTLLWKQAFEYLQGLHWIYGYGYKHNFQFTISWWFASDHPHNEYLEMLFCYGVIGLGIYIKMVVKQFQAVWNINNREVRDIMLATLVSIVVMHISSHNYMAVFPYISYVVFVNMDKIMVEK